MKKAEKEILGKTLTVGDSFKTTTGETMTVQDIWEYPSYVYAVLKNGKRGTKLYSIRLDHNNIVKSTNVIKF